MNAAPRTDTLIRHHANREFFGYWDGLRAGERVPEQRLMDPAAIGEALPDVFIIDRTEPGVYTIRLAGTRLCAFWGRELRGTNALDLWSGADREGAEMLLFSVLEDAAVAVATQHAITARGHGLELEMVAMPLNRRTAEGVERRIIGTLSPWRTPFWLGTESLVKQTLDNARLVWPDRPAAPIGGRAAPSMEGFTGHNAPYTMAQGDETGSANWSTADALADLARLRGGEASDVVFESEQEAGLSEGQIGDDDYHPSGARVLARRAHLTLLAGGASLADGESGAPAGPTFDPAG